jgi:hypothetical protein
MTKHKITNIVLITIVIVAVGFGGYFYYKLHKLETDANGKIETQDLISKVSKLYLMPTGEEPTIATVSSPEKLKDQAFFNQAEKGDKVLIFSKAMKAVLYRPSIDKIIEIAPVNNQTQVNKNAESSADTITATSAPAKVAPVVPTKVTTPTKKK